MTLRRRLAIWYSTVLAVVLAVALFIAYDLHTEAHDSDVDTALQELTQKAESDLDEQLHSGVPLSAVDLSALHAPIDEPYALWLFVDDKAVASAGRDQDPVFAEAGVATMTDGWHTNWTVDGRVRTYVVSIGVGRIATSAALAVIDAANSELRYAYTLLGLIAVGIGFAITSTIAGSALRPIATLTDTANAIATSRDFHRRVPRIEGDDEDELVVLAKTFDDMLSSLDDAYRQQQRFLGDVSHELRTPLTTIRGHAELLASGELERDAERDAVVRIGRESARLARLVDELLVLARAEAAESFAPREVHLDEIVMETFEEFRPLSEGRLRVPWIESCAVRGERDRLKQLVVALVDNAMRYTPAPGSVSVSLSDDGHDAVLRVDDEGIGIADADLPRIFERFYRGDAARRVNRSGSGLGLAIVRWIVERHKGSIRIERGESGVGTSVTVRLPLAVAAAAA